MCAISRVSVSDNVLCDARAPLWCSKVFVATYAGTWWSERRPGRRQARRRAPRPRCAPRTSWPPPPYSCWPRSRDTVAMQVRNNTNIAFANVSATYYAHSKSWRFRACCPPSRHTSSEQPPPPSTSIESPVCNYRVRDLWWTSPRSSSTDFVRKSLFARRREITANENESNRTKTKCPRTYNVSTTRIVFSSCAPPPSSVFIENRRDLILIQLH